MELLGVQQVLTSPYYPQGNGIIERSHRTVANMLRAHLAHREDGNWVDMLPGVMLLYNKMEQEQHGYTASQIMWGRSMNLPTDLIYNRKTPKGEKQSDYTTRLRQELQGIKDRVSPFNQAEERPSPNPFRVGELVLIYQQPME